MRRARALALRVVTVLGLPGALFALWWFASAGSSSFYLPPLREILVTFGQVWGSERLMTDVAPSVGRLAGGYGLAAVLGIGLGVAIGLYRRLRQTVEPVLEFARAIPPPVMVPILMIVAGIGNTMKVFVIVFGCIWPILLNTIEGVRGIDQMLVDTARSFRMRRFSQLREVTVPAASPQIFAGLRQALPIAIILMVISEMFAASSGLGFTIVRFQRSFAMPEMWSGIILLGLLGFALSILFRAAEARSLRWYEGIRAAERGGPPAP